MTWYRERCWKRSLTAGTSPGDCAPAPVANIEATSATAHARRRGGDEREPERSESSRSLGGEERGNLECFAAAARHRGTVSIRAGDIAVAVWLQIGRVQSRKPNNVMGIWFLTATRPRTLNARLPS